MPKISQIADCKHCGKNLASYKACRINGTAYIELYINHTPIAVVKQRDDIPKEDWDAVYQEFKQEAERRTTFEFEAEQKVIRA